VLLVEWSKPEAASVDGRLRKQEGAWQLPEHHIIRPR